ncbi:polymeric immunoglobulin receptor-like isoform X2 [Leucoraja erinacea]|uniref:polymeric immunoglobulin receptor-like isoform X2 n=1 Tax=Leucoraja erinaceus TaxID=7782 RepID=UPI00245881AE|nr:polymeric immunoglobulin receptor-like isoform X2 [Leucoraja erinacea]
MAVGQGEFTLQRRPRSRGTVALLVLVAVGLTPGSRGITEPEEVRGELGQSVTVECQYGRKYKDNDKLWSKGDYFFPSSTVVSTDDPQRGRTSMTDFKEQRIVSVTIDKLEKSDEGLYWCVIVKGNDSPIVSASISLTVSEGSRGITGPEEVRGQLGQSVTVECQYGQEYTDNKKLWSKGDSYRNSYTVFSTDDQRRGRTSMTDDKEQQIVLVTIDKLKKSDEGLYWCVIVKGNDSLIESTSISLTVSEGSRGITGPKEVRGELGQSVTVECRYGQEYTDNKKLWSKGYYYTLSDTVVSTDDSQQGRTSMTDNETKRIVSVTIGNLKKSDEGYYWCVIGKGIFSSNEKTSISLTVSEGSQTSRPDMVTTTSTTISTKASTTTTLTTMPQGTPTTKAASSTEASSSTPPNRDAFPWKVVLSIALTIVFLLFIAGIILCVKMRQRKKTGSNEQRIMSQQNPADSFKETPVIYTTVTTRPPASTDNTYMNLQDLNTQGQAKRQGAAEVVYATILTDNN